MSTNSSVSTFASNNETDVIHTSVNATHPAIASSSSACATVETPSQATAMEMDDDAFQSDASAFALSLDELADANAPDQLYEDLTGEYPKSPLSNQIDHEHENEPSESREAEPCVKQEDLSQLYSVPTASTAAPSPTRSSPARADDKATPPPLAAIRKSPRRNTTASSSKAATTKKTTTGTKRTSQSQSQSQSSFSWNDILQVQNLIERCLQQLLSKNDIVLTLQAQAKVDPAFTAVVWQKLEEQNPAFFRAYALQLQLREQITAFNFLVSQQKEMMAKASGNAAFLSFLASSDARKTQRQAMLRGARMGSMPQARGRSLPQFGSIQMGTTSASAVTTDMPSSTHAILFPLTSPLPLPSPMKTDLDTHAFFS